MKKNKELEKLAKQYLADGFAGDMAEVRILAALLSGGC